MLLLLFGRLFNNGRVLRLVGGLSLVAFFTLLTVFLVRLGHFVQVAAQVLVRNHWWMHAWREKAGSHLVMRVALAEEIRVVIRVVDWWHAVHVFEGMVRGCLGAAHVALTLVLRSHVHVSLMATLWSKHKWNTASAAVLSFSE